MKIRIYYEKTTSPNPIELLIDLLFDGRWGWQVTDGTKKTAGGWARTEAGARRKAEKVCRGEDKRYVDYTYEYDPDGDPDAQQRSSVREEVQTGQSGSSSPEGQSAQQGAQ